MAYRHKTLTRENIIVRHVCVVSFKRLHLSVLSEEEERNSIEQGIQALPNEQCTTDQGYRKLRLNNIYSKIGIKIIEI